MTLAEVLSIPRSCSTTAAQNDEFRGTARLGQVMCTPGVLELGERFVAAALAAVRTDQACSPDQAGANDAGCVTVDGIRLLWQITYYSRSGSFLSPNPADPEDTMRVLTIMLAEEN